MATEKLSFRVDADTSNAQSGLRDLLDSMRNATRANEQFASTISKQVSKINDSTQKQIETLQKDMTAAMQKIGSAVEQHTAKQATSYEKLTTAVKSSVSKIEEQSIKSVAKSTEVFAKLEERIQKNFERIEIKSENSMGRITNLNFRMMNRMINGASRMSASYDAGFTKMEKRATKNEEHINKTFTNSFDRMEKRADKLAAVGAKSFLTMIKAITKVLRAVKRLEELMLRMDRNTTQINRKIKQGFDTSTQSVDRFTKRANSASGSIVRLGGSVRSIERSGFLALGNLNMGMRNLIEAGNSIHRTFFGIKTLLLSFAGGFFFKRAIQEAIEFENAFVGLSSVANAFGDSMDNARNAAVRLASDGLINIREASQAMKNLIPDFGVKKAEELASTLKDIGSFNRQGTLSLGQALVGSTQGLKNRLSILVDNIGLTKNLSQIMKEQGMRMEDLDDVIKGPNAKLKLFDGLMREAAFATGDAEKLVQTMSGSISRLTVQYQLLLREIGDAIIEHTAFKTAVNTVSKVIKETLPNINGWVKSSSEWVQANSDLVISLGKTIAKMGAFAAVVPVLGAVLLPVLSVLSTLNNTIRFLGFTYAAVGPIITRVVAKTALKMMTLGTAAKDAAKNIQKKVKALVRLTEKQGVFKTLQNLSKNMFSAAAGAGVFAFKLGLVAAAAFSLVAIFKGITLAIKNFGIGAQIDEILADMKFLTKSIFSLFAVPIKLVERTVIGAVNLIKIKLGELAKEYRGWAIGAMKLSGKSFAESITAVDNLIAKSDELKEKYAGSFSVITAEAQKAFDFKTDSILLEGLNNQIDGMFDAGKRIKDALSDGFSTAGDPLFDGLRFLIKDIKKDLKDLGIDFEAIGRLGSESINTVKLEIESGGEGFKALLTDATSLENALRLIKEGAKSMFSPEQLAMLDKVSEKLAAASEFAMEKFREAQEEAKNAGDILGKNISKNVKKGIDALAEFKKVLSDSLKEAFTDGLSGEGLSFGKIKNAIKKFYIDQFAEELKKQTMKILFPDKQKSAQIRGIEALDKNTQEIVRNSEKLSEVKEEMIKMPKLMRDSIISGLLEPESSSSAPKDIVQLTDKMLESNKDMLKPIYGPTMDIAAAANFTASKQQSMEESLLAIKENTAKAANQAKDTGSGGFFSKLFGKESGGVAGVVSKVTQFGMLKDLVGNQGGGISGALNTFLGTKQIAGNLFGGLSAGNLNVIGTGAALIGGIISKNKRNKARREAAQQARTAAASNATIFDEYIESIAESMATFSASFLNAMDAATSDLRVAVNARQTTFDEIVNTIDEVSTLRTNVEKSVRDLLASGDVHAANIGSSVVNAQQSLADAMEEAVKQVEEFGSLRLQEFNAFRSFADSVADILIEFRDIKTGFQELIAKTPKEQLTLSREATRKSFEDTLNILMPGLGSQITSGFDIRSLLNVFQGLDLNSVAKRLQSVQDKQDPNSISRIAESIKDVARKTDALDTQNVQFGTRFNDPQTAIVNVLSQGRLGKVLADEFKGFTQQGIAKLLDGFVASTANSQLLNQGVLPFLFSGANPQGSQGSQDLMTILGIETDTFSSLFTNINEQQELMRALNSVASSLVSEFETLNSVVDSISASIVSFEDVIESTNLISESFRTGIEDSIESVRKLGFSNSQIITENAQIINDLFQKLGSDQITNEVKSVLVKRFDESATDFNSRLNQEVFDRQQAVASQLQSLITSQASTAVSEFGAGSIRSQEFKNASTEQLNRLDDLMMSVIEEFKTQAEQSREQQIKELSALVKEATGSEITVSSLADAQFALQADMTQTLAQLEEVMVALGGSLIQQTDTFESAIFQMTDTLNGTLQNIDSFLKDALQGIASQMGMLGQALSGGNSINVSSFRDLSSNISAASPALTQSLTPNAISQSVSGLRDAPTNTASLSDITSTPSGMNNISPEINIYITEKVDKAVVENEIIPVIEQAMGRNGQVKLA